MYADDALDAEATILLEEHASTCDACRARILALRQENEALRAALHALYREAPIPRFTPPFRLRDLVILVIGGALVGGIANAFWSAVGAAVPAGLRWLNPLHPGELLERAIELATFMIFEGTTMLTTALNFVGVALLLAFSAWAAFGTLRRKALAAAAVATVIVTIAPSTGHALERRQGNLVSVAAGETIEDTLLALGDTIAIDGNIDGDLLAFGRSVIVRGNVAGNLVAGAETVNVEGSIGGSVIGGARAISLVRARIGRDFYGFARDVELDSAAEVAGNGLAFAENIGVDGRVGTDFMGFGSTVTIGGSVDGDVEGFAGTVTVLPSAIVAGNVTAHVDAPGDLTVAPGANVSGSVEEQLVPREERRNRYLTVGYYVRQIVRLGAAFLTGLLLLWAFPALREASLPNAVAVLRAGGIGLAAAVTLPVAAVVLGITLVGLPIGVLLLVLGAIGLYFAKTVLAQIIGRAIFGTPDSPPHYAATLVTGLLIVIVAINLPWIGGFANFVMTLVGFGVIVQLLLARFAGGSLR
jgi:cytoskeletal protein CcmA (bactofilin family)